MEIKNRSAYYEYFFDDKYVAGIILTGTEVKSLREGKASFNDSYCLLHKGELLLKSFHIAEYSHGNLNNHEPLRERKLLLQKRELKKIAGKLKEKGYTLIPLRLFLAKKTWQKLKSVWVKAKSYTTRETRLKKEM